MGPQTTLDGERVRVLETKLVDDESRGEPGTILDRVGEELLVQCGDRPIRVVRTERVSR